MLNLPCKYLKFQDDPSKNDWEDGTLIQFLVVKDIARAIIADENGEVHQRTLPQVRLLTDDDHFIDDEE